ncbi:TetR/AcrR family transcriptional regulator [Thermogemmatispora sp.]|uniref:TetR/AcrR family transcriptional regulator n=1 Tax=Thermogemmatispora sp. TaxID=1968838 RepID=UPI001DBB93DB|nr:TetR/AcrR family transcriptional regulator [Thermogemmatispora sp.]MBX5450830.1 TetR/AcrR family transcriptional regulator [Thermogemmatispora sp.]
MIIPESASDSVQRRPGRPRSVQAHIAILNAALEELADAGYQGMTIEGVAARAGVSKATIYRRWSSKEELIIEAAHRIYTDIPIINTGHLQRDFVAIYTLAYRALQQNPFLQRLFFRAIGEAHANPEIYRAFVERLFAPRLQQFIELIREAQERGELRRDLDPWLVIDLIAGPLFYHLMLGPLAPSQPPPLDESLIERLIEAVFLGLAPRSAASSS